MNKLFMSMLGVLAFSIIGWSQSVSIYSDANPKIAVSWVNYGTITEIDTGAYEGSKCLDFSYALTYGWADAAIFPAGANGIVPLQGRQYKYFQFAVKVSTANMNFDSLGLWCIHCLNGADGYSPAVPFSPTVQWKVISVPTSTWSSGTFLDADVLSCLHFTLIGSSNLTGHIYIDDMKFTDTDIVATLPAAPRSSNELTMASAGNFRIVFAKGTISLLGPVPEGMISVRVFDEKGRMIAGKDALNKSRSFAVGRLAKGVYFVNVHVSDKKCSRCFMVN